MPSLYHATLIFGRLQYIISIYKTLVMPAIHHSVVPRHAFPKNFLPKYSSGYPHDLFRQMSRSQCIHLLQGGLVAREGLLAQLRLAQHIHFDFFAIVRLLWICAPLCPARTYHRYLLCVYVFKSSSLRGLLDHLEVSEVKTEFV